MELVFNLCGSHMICERHLHTIFSVIMLIHACSNTKTLGLGLALGG